MKNIFRLASLLTAAVMLVACRGNNDDPNQGQTGSGKLEITTDKTLIQSNGSDIATLTVTLDGAVVKDGVEFFDAKLNPLDIVDGKFSVTAPGEYQVWATYGTAYSDKVTIRAITIPVPATPSDPKPASTDFKAKVLLTQFTGTACGYCPGMMLKLHPVLEDPAMADKIVWVASHSYGWNASYPDPASISSDFCDVLGGQHPSLNLDLKLKFLNTAANNTEALRGYVNEFCEAKKEVASGIAVNVKLADDVVVAKVTIKAAETAEYRVGGFLLEDGLKATQISASETWMNTHNACIRHIDATNNYRGHKIGKINKGETVDYAFVWDLNKIWKQPLAEKKWKEWVEENLRVAFFVTCPDADGNYSVNNAVECAVNSQLKFEYK